MSDISISSSSLSSINGMPVGTDSVAKDRVVFEDDAKKDKVYNVDQKTDFSKASDVSDVEKSFRGDEVKSKDVESEGKKKVGLQEKEISKALQERNEKLAEERMHALNKQNIGLNFSIDKVSEDTIVKVTDRNTDKLVRQIPSEEFLKFAEKLREMREQNQGHPSDEKAEAIGLLFDDQA